MNLTSFISRGGDKLCTALDAFEIDVAGARVLDAGASTGGFTDCLLSLGAREVVAVDVGYGQFAWELRNDARVKLLERTNVRGLVPDMIGGLVEIAVADLSFISLRLVVPVLETLVIVGGPLVLLFKPQFEVGKRLVGKGGVVRDPALHAQALSGFAAWAAGRALGPVALAISSPRGTDGNVEFWWRLAAGSERSVAEEDIARIVALAHEG